MAVDIYKPEQWHDFFLLVGTGAATLTGLVFVAMTINLKTINKDLVHRYRAISTLAGLTAVFMRCSLVLIAGEKHQAVGAELGIIAAVAAAIFLKGVFRTLRSNIPNSHPSISRTVGSVGLYLVEIAGAIILISGSISGLYIAAVAMVTNFSFMISGAWLLLVGPVLREKRS